MFREFNETCVLVAKTLKLSLIFSLSVISFDMRSSFSSCVNSSAFRNGNLGEIAKNNHRC